MKRFIKTYDSFRKNENSSPLTAPTTKPAQPTTKPGTAPTTKPGRPGPIPTIRPSVDPLPKAKQKKATEEDIYNRFIHELKQLGDKEVDFDLAQLKQKYSQNESVDTNTGVDNSVIEDFKSLIAGDYSREEAYKEIIASYDEESLTPEVLSELELYRKGKQ